MDTDTRWRVSGGLAAVGTVALAVVATFLPRTWLTAAAAVTASVTTVFAFMDAKKRALP